MIQIYSPLIPIPAGVSLGPFPDYKSKLFSGSAGELFEFADPESSVSKRYEDALRVAVKYGVRITYCGSIDDQLVSMEVCGVRYSSSSNWLTICSPLSSRRSAILIFTGLCLWTAVYTPRTCKPILNYSAEQNADRICSLSHLVGFALKLRNLGVSDHGLIRELSAPLAGSLYTGEGHSRLYDDDKVYE
jgi:hypothetical protein